MHKTPHDPQMTSVSQLLDTYDVFLLDAYGVLVTSAGVLPGAQNFINELHRRKKSFYIISNDASRLPETAMRFYQSLGLQIEQRQVLTAGLAIEDAFQRYALHAPRCAVLGTRDTETYVERAGGRVVNPLSEDFDAVVVGDDSGFEIWPTLNAVLTRLHRLHHEGAEVHRFVANPDLLYPRGGGQFAFTSGSLARILEIGLAELNHGHDFKFEVLGKPAPLLFERALRDSGVARERAVMLGDQLPTDIRGANGAGIASCLVGTGLTRVPLAKLPADAELRPRWMLAYL